jgi:hypothetical protein
LKISLIYIWMKIVEYVHQYSKLFLNNDTKTSSLINTSRSANGNNSINTDTIFSNSNQNPSLLLNLKKKQFFSSRNLVGFETCGLYCLLSGIFNDSTSSCFTYCLPFKLLGISGCYGIYFTKSKYRIYFFLFLD